MVEEGLVGDLLDLAGDFDFDFVGDLVLGLDFVTLLGAGAGDLLFRVAARSARLVVVPVVALWLVEEVREEREEELEPEPEPEVPLAIVFGGAVPLLDLAVVVADFLGSAFLAAGFFFVAAAFVVFFFVAGAFFLVTPAAFVRGP